MSKRLNKDSKGTSIYIAAPLFNSAERKFNQELKEKLTLFFDVFLPQADGGLIVERIQQGLNPERAAREIFDLDIEAINRCDILVIVLDGRTVDEGAAFELGYAYAKGKLCYGLQTDQRRALSFGNNPMIECSCEKVFESIGALSDWLERRYIGA